MTAPLREAETTIDGQGVDRTQIRQMLTMTPAERLLRLQEMVEGILEIRERNVRRTLP
jgi:hypothetical protein